VKLKLERVGFSYNGKDPAILDVSFSADACETLALIGPNGSGKSTLLKCIASILQPQGGRIFINGKDLKDAKLDEKARMVGYVPQVEKRGFPATVFDTILLGRKPYMTWKPSSHDLEIVSSIIHMLDLGELSMRDIDSLSGGETQKVLIARALAQQPEILLLDEPTSNLDLKHQLEVLDLIRKQTKNGIVSVAAMHDLNMAARYADKVVMLKGGRVFASGGLEVISPGNIAKVYEVRASVGKHAGRFTVTPLEPLAQ